MKLLIALLVLAAWIGLTALAAWAVPPRGGDEPPDLSVDPHWLNRTPPNPVHYDRVPRGTRATTTTTTRHTTPPPNASPRPRNLQSPRQMQAPAQFAAGVEQWRGLVAAQGGWNTDLMLRIMDCESKGRADAKNPGSSATGLFQILGGPYDPAANVSLAHSMWATRGTQPWNASRSCWG